MLCAFELGGLIGSKFKVQSSRFKVQGSKFKVQSSRFKVSRLIGYLFAIFIYLKGAHEIASLSCH